MRQVYSGDLAERHVAAVRRYNATPKGKDQAAEYRRNHMSQFCARMLVSRLIRAGRLIRRSCEICGSSVRVEAHHPFGYEGVFAIAVWWLCQSHHRGMHRAVAS